MSQSLMQRLAGKLPRRRAWLVDFGVWTALALLYAGRSIAVGGSGGTATATLLIWLECCYVWALLTFPVMALARALPFARKHRMRNALLHVAAAIAVAALAILPDALASNVIYPEFPAPSFADSYARVFRGYAHWNLLNYAYVVIVWHALDYWRRLRAEQLRAAEFEAGLRRAELDALRMQLNPHFLFNALNTIGVLMHDDVDAAQEVLADLNGILRAVLRPGTRQMSPLREELTLLCRYLAIEQARFGDRLVVRFDIDPRLDDVQVPSLLLQPIVENAIRHGVGARIAGGHVEIATASRGGDLVLTVTDNGPGLPPARREGGIGIANTRARLTKLYDARQSFQMRPATGGGLVVEMRLPLQRIPAASLAEAE